MSDEPLVEVGKHLSNDQVTALLNVSHERVSAAGRISFFGGGISFFSR